MQSIRDLLTVKADAIESDGVQGDIHLIQAEINRYFKGVTVQNIKDDGAAMLTTPSSSVASDIRLRQHQLVTDLNSMVKQKLTRLHIRIQ